MNRRRLAGFALEQALASRLRDLLGGISWLPDWQVEHVGDKADTKFDLIAKLALPGGRVTLYVDRHERRDYFTLLRGMYLREALYKLELHAGGFAAYGAFSAAEFQAPHVRQPKTWIYVRASGLLDAP